MRAPLTRALARSSSGVPQRAGLSPRTCACSETAGLAGECQQCRAQRSALQQQPWNPTTSAGHLPAVQEALRSRVAPLDPALRAPVESRFGHDFGQVRVHTDSRAAAASRTLSAEAFTVGDEIFFDHGRFAPHTNAGRHLLAHELAHTVQQSRAATSRVVGIDASPEREAEADRAAQAMTGEPPTPMAMPLSRGLAAIQRKVVVGNPTGVPAGAPATETNEKIARDYVTTLCPDFTVTAGEVVPTGATTCLSTSTSAPESCACLCTMDGLTDPDTGSPITWTIDVNDKDWPHTDPLTQTVTVHSPFSGLESGAWAKGPVAHRMSQPNWLVLGHELCGHARLFEEGTHPTGPAPRHGGRPSHAVTVGIENAIAAEHGVPATELRGLFADPHHGESFSRVTVGPFAFGSDDLPAAAAPQLDAAEAFIKSAAVNMDVIGHADQEGGSDAANLAISQRRAFRVRKALQDRQIAEKRFFASRGVGATECPAPGLQPSCRTVEIFMFIMRGASITHGR